MFYLDWIHDGFMLICVYIYSLWFYNLFSAHSSLNLVGLCLSFSFTKRVVLFTPSFPILLRLNADPFFRAVVVIHSVASLLGACCHSIHWTILLILCFISSSIHYIFTFYYDHSVCIAIVIPWHSCWIGGWCSLFLINCFDDFNVGYPMMKFVLSCFINCILLILGLGLIYIWNSVKFSVDFWELDYFGNHVW